MDFHFHNFQAGKYYLTHVFHSIVHRAVGTSPGLIKTGVSLLCCWQRRPDGHFEMESNERQEMM